MKNLKFLGTILMIILSVSQVCLGQVNNSGSGQELNEKDDLANELPPLGNLIDIALQNSPLLKYNDNVIDQGEREVKLEKRSWHDRISVLGNYSQGDQALLIGSQTSGGGFGGNALNGWRLGANVNIPLSTVTTRRLRIQIAELQVDAARNQKDEIERQVKNQVILEYYQLISAYRIMKIKSGARESAVLQRTLAETYFSEGSISLEDYSNVDQIGANVEVDYEMAKSEYLAKYRQFEQLLGVSLDDLKR